MKNKINFLIIFVFISVLIFSGFKCTRNDRVKPINLVVWNLWDNQESWNDMIASYEAYVASDKTKTPVKIVYYKKTLAGNERYEDSFNNALSEGNGPDIVTLNNSWLPRYKNKIYPLDGDARTVKDFKRKFVDVVASDFLDGNKIYAVPLSLDSLALYYNIDILNAAGIYDPPKTWEEFNDDVRKLTIRDDKGGIKNAGVAMGTDKNVNRSSDILSLLMMQSGSRIVDKKMKRATFDDSLKDNNTEETIGSTALRFYTDFANPTKTVYSWNPLMKYSIDAFYQMKTAMMINYAYNVSVVKSKAPNLHFAIAPMPQITGVTIPVNYANYWAMAVSKGSTHKKEAWDFLMYITNPEITKKYLTKTNKPAAQRDLVSWQENGEDLDLAVFAKQSLTAKSWYQRDNFATDTIFDDAINSVVLGRSTPKSASILAASRLDQVMKR